MLVLRFTIIITRCQTSVVREKKITIMPTITRCRVFLFLFITASSRSSTVPVDPNDVFLSEKIRRLFYRIFIGNAADNALPSAV